MSDQPVSKAPAAAPLTLTTKNSVFVRLAERYGITSDTLMATVKATLMPPNSTNEELVAFLLVADRYDLDPFLKQIYAFPKKGGGIVPMVPIDGWIRIAQQHEQYRGFTQRIVNDETFGAGIETTIYRADWPQPAVRVEWLNECKVNSGPWNSHPGRMLGHKSFIQDARYAFGISGIYDEDEAERIRDIEATVTAPPSRDAALAKALGMGSPPDEKHDPAADDMGETDEREPGEEG